MITFRLDCTKQSDFCQGKQALLSPRKTIPQGFPFQPPWMWMALTTLHFSQASGKRSAAKEDRRVRVVTGFPLHNFGLSPQFIASFL